MPINVPEWIVRITGNLRFSKYPMFVQYKPNQHKVKGYEAEALRYMVEPGDIILRVHKGYISNLTISGYYGHAGLYVGDQNFPFIQDKIGVVRKVPSMIHSVLNGVIIEPLSQFCRCDGICVLRLSLTRGQKQEAINKAFNFLEAKVGYDFNFESGAEALYCTELVDECYEKYFKDFYTPFFDGHTILLPDDLRKHKGVETIVEFRH